MTWLWIYWPAALACIAFLIFAVPEAIALKTGKGPTFSYFMATVRASSFGPIWIWLWGVLCGGLVVHFSTWCMYNVPDYKPLGFGSSYIHGDATSEKKVGK